MTYGSTSASSALFPGRSDVEVELGLRLIAEGAVVVTGLGAADGDISGGGNG